MSTFTVRVKIEIIDEDGEIVNHKGKPAVARTDGSLMFAQECRVNVVAFDNIDEANNRMNTLFQIADSMKRMIHG